MSKFSDKTLRPRSLPTSRPFDQNIKHISGSFDAASGGSSDNAPWHCHPSRVKYFLQENNSSSSSLCPGCRSGSPTSSSCGSRTSSSRPRRSTCSPGSSSPSCSPCSTSGTGATISQSLGRTTRYKENNSPD